jgi:type I restriction enzyme, S subunit
MSSKEWKTYKLQTLCSLITDGKHGDCQNQDNSGYYFLSAKDVSDGKLFYENARQITKEDFDDTNRRTQLEPLDVLITNSGTIGRMAISTNNELTNRTTFQKSVALLKPIKQKIFPYFLYYCLLSRKKDLVNTASGTTQQNLLLGDLRAFEIEMSESIEDQRRIATILSALDDKIELNHQTNATLESIAQAIFKQWFVDFNFPGATGERVESELGMIPKGWRILPLDEIANFLNGLALQKFPPENGRNYLPVIKI